ncbi:Holliday junction resolvase RuvX [Sorangium cellulosum]|uniref:Holliday junction resolvase RuvX n=1 Tax=Sorangium cellulosum TaxID=56 RepID=UPI003D9AB341
MAKAKTRAAAIDLGKARVGVAVTDELGLYAHPRPLLDGRNRKALLEALAALARDEGLTRFLVGLPLEMNGDEGPAARRAVAFAQALADATGVEVELLDERLTTVEAARRLRDGGISARKSKERVDGAAAALLLQAWLDGRRS